jgi:hypothetical protein
MRQACTRTLLATLATLAALGCGGDATSPELGTTAPPRTDSADRAIATMPALAEGDTCTLTPSQLVVTTATTGNSRDLDPVYVISEAPAASPNTEIVGPNASFRFFNVPAGRLEILLANIEGNCTVTGPNPQVIDVAPSSTASAKFEVTCAPIPARSGRATGFARFGDGDSTRTPGFDNNLQTVDLDVRADLTGTFVYTDYSILEPNGTPARMVVNPNDPGTRIVAFQASSAMCADASQGVEVAGVGRGPLGDLFDFTAIMCDGGSGPSDFFRVDIQNRPPETPFTYTFGRSLTSGDITRAGS